MLADRGFGAPVRYERLAILGWRQVIRFRGAILVEHEGAQRPASAWLLPNGCARKRDGARVTADKTPVEAVVTVRAKSLKEAGSLATNVEQATATESVKRSGRRFPIEETFRDAQDLRFGRGLRATHIRNAARRDRLLMLLAIAIAFRTLSGAASEGAGMDAWLRANTVKRRTHSLFRQGSYWSRCLPPMSDEWFEGLMSALAAGLREHQERTEMMRKI